MSNADELKKLKELLDSGVLSQEEFDKEKNKLLDIEPKADTPSNDPEIKNSKDKKERKIKKSYIVGGILLLFFLIGSIGGDSSSDNISSINSSTSSNSSSNSSSNCVIWSNQTADNAGKVADIMFDVSENAGDASIGAISLSTFESLLKSDLRKAKNIYNNQLSTTPNSENRVSHNYFIDALEDLIDGLDYAILGVESGDSYYIELGILYIEDAGTNAELATLALEGC